MIPRQSIFFSFFFFKLNESLKFQVTVLWIRMTFWLGVLQPTISTNKQQKAIEDINPYWCPNLKDIQASSFGDPKMKSYLAEQSPRSASIGKIVATDSNQWLPSVNVPFMCVCVYMGIYSKFLCGDNRHRFHQLFSHKFNFVFKYEHLLQESLTM